AVASGRRYACTVVDDAPAPSGSSKLAMKNSPAAGIAPPRRNRPLRSMLYDARFACSDDTSGVGLLASIGLKIGSLPCVSRNFNSTSIGRMLQPTCGKWHDSQERPLAPCGTWNGFVRSTKPAVLKVAAVPAPLRKGKLFGSRPSKRSARPSACAPTPPSVAIAPSVINRMPGGRDFDDLDLFISMSPSLE